VRGRSREVNNRRTLHIEANVMAIVALDSAERSDYISASASAKRDAAGSFPLEVAS
jgi:hypothetical protein